MRAGQIACALAVLVPVLTGCSDRMGDYPKLLPTEQLLADPALPAHAADAPEDIDAALEARAAGLARRATAAAPTPATGDLAARATALRERAQALSQTSPSDCPPEDESCTPATPQQDR